MNVKGFHCYDLEISGSKNARCIKQKKQNGVPVNFSKPVTNSKTPKIYIVQKDQEIIYVGYASQPIGNRLRGGLKAHGKNGYHGYTWKELDKVQLTVFVFEAFEGSSKEQESQKKFAEGVEAELVYLIRNTTGKWPRSQNEIHFNNHNAMEVKQTAIEIYNQFI